MSYTDIDLIDKSISIANSQKEIYLKINEDKCNSPSMKILLKT